MMKLNEESILDLVVAVWKRRKWMGIVSFLLPFSLAVGTIAFLPSIYRSSATVLVDRQQVPEAFVRPTVTSGLETRLQTISQEVFSRARLDAIINRFQLYDDLKKRVAAEEVIERMRSDIQLEYRGVDRAGQRGTIAFAVSFRGKDPQTVAQVTNTLASFFIEPVPPSSSRPSLPRSRPSSTGRKKRSASSRSATWWTCPSRPR